MNFSIRPLQLSLVILALGVLGIGFFWPGRPIASYIPDQPLWVYQSATHSSPLFHPALQAAGQQAKKWLSSSSQTYWIASGHKIDAQQSSYLLYLPLPDSEREFIQKVKGKVGRRVYQDSDILALVDERLYAVEVNGGWLLSPSEILLEKALDGPQNTFSGMPLHPENDFSALFLAKNTLLPSFAQAPWSEDQLYLFRPNQRVADLSAPDFLTKAWTGQLPKRVDSWRFVPEQLSRLDLWNISSRERWAVSHPEWPAAWHFLLPESGGACWQFQVNGETPILWLPIEDPEAISFLSGGLSAQGGIYPLALSFLGQKTLGEPLPNHQYFMPMEGGIAFSETVSALQWYQNQRLMGLSAAQSNRFTQHIIPELLPRQSRMTLLFPDNGPSYLAWEGIVGAQQEASARFCYGPPKKIAQKITWIKQTFQGSPPPPTSPLIHQDPTGMWFVGSKSLGLRTGVKTTNLATWHPQEGLWIGDLKQQTVYHAKTKRTFEVTSDSPMVGLFQKVDGQSCILTQFGQIIPLNPLEGLLIAQSTQLERLDRNTQFQVLQASNGDPLILRKDLGMLTLFDPTGNKWSSIQPSMPHWQQIQYEVLPNNLGILVLFDGQSHYLYTREGNWLGQKEIPGSGPIRIQYAASYRKLMVYTQQHSQWQLWALGPIDD